MTVEITYGGCSSATRDCSQRETRGALFNPSSNRDYAVVGSGYREHFSPLIWGANSRPHAGAPRSFRTTPGRWLQCNNLNFNDSGDHLWRLRIRHSRLQPAGTGGALFRPSSNRDCNAVGSGYREHYSSLIWGANSGPRAGAPPSFRTTPGRWLQCNNLNVNDSGDHLPRSRLGHSRLPIGTPRLVCKHTARQCRFLPV